MYVYVYITIHKYEKFNLFQVWTPGEITLTEAVVTVLQYGLLLLHAYAQDKRWPYVSLPLYVFLSPFNEFCFVG